MNTLKWKITTRPLSGLNQYHTNVDDKTYVIHEEVNAGKLLYLLLNMPFETLERAKMFVTYPYYCKLSH